MTERKFRDTGLQTSRDDKKAGKLLEEIKEETKETKEKSK
jgi:hypothetical protein